MPAYLDDFGFLRGCPHEDLSREFLEKQSMNPSLPTFYAPRSWEEIVVGA